MKKQFIVIAALGIIASMTSCGQDIISTAPAAAQTAATEAATAEASQAAEATAAPAADNAAPAATAAPAADSNAAPAAEKPTEPDLSSQILFGGYAATESGDLNLRITPDTNAEIVAKIPSGTQLEIHATGVRGWYLTTYGGHNGYVSADFIKELTDYEQSPADALEKSNEYGFFPVTNPPASSVSVASLAGTWLQAGGNETKLDITAGSDIYNGNFAYTVNGNTVNGYIKLEYNYTQSGDREYWYNFYDNSGAFWHGFGVSGEIPLNDIYADQQGEPHFVRTEQ